MSASENKALLVKKDLYWVGALHPELRCFDVIMTTPFGTTYNSFLLKGQKANVLFETVKETHFTRLYLTAPFFSLHFVLTDDE